MFMSTCVLVTRGCMPLSCSVSTSPHKVSIIHALVSSVSQALTGQNGSKCFSSSRRTGNVRKYCLLLDKMRIVWIRSQACEHVLVLDRKQASEPPNDLNLALPIAVLCGRKHAKLCSNVLKLPTPTYRVIKTPWPLVRKRTIPTERPPLVDEI
jgi:hypothetical protein